MSPPDDTLEPPSTPRSEDGDPYRWLEDDGERVREWTAAQNEYADRSLATSTAERLRSRLAAFARVPEYGPVETAGGRQFRTVRGADEDHARLVVRSAPDGDETVLVDPARREWDPDRSLQWFLPSPDGEYVACGVAGGDENVDVHVLTADGERIATLEDRGRVFRAVVGYDPTSPGAVTWGGEGLYYVATDEEAGASELRCWQPDGERTLLTHEGPEWCLVRAHRETLAVALQDVSGTEWYVYADGDLHPALGDGESETFVAFCGERVFVQTDRDAPRKRLLSCSLDRFRAGVELPECETVLPEREAVLQSFVTSGDSLVAHYLVDATARLAVYDQDGTHRRDLDVPENAAVSHLRAGESGSVTYRVESFDRPQAVVRGDATTGERRVIARPELPVPDLVVDRAFVESADGTEVPLFVCHREDLDGEAPAVLYGYGGFGKSLTPGFDRFRIPFLADGGVFAQVCARGGGEYGREHHRAGTGADLHRTFEDFVAAGEYLVRAGYTTPDRLGVLGHSNGALSAAGAVLARADLWGALVCSAPILDLCRYHELGIGEAWTGEYGDPREVEYPREHSPYHQIAADVAYPPTLLVAGGQDTRVHPAHARKVAARLQAQAEGGPFLLRTTEVGHGGAGSATATVREQAERWAFLYDQLGVE